MKKLTHRKSNLLTTKKKKTQQKQKTTDQSHSFPQHIKHDNNGSEGEILKFIEYIYIFPLEQKGCKKESYDNKDQFLINKMIMKNCRSKQKKSKYGWG